MWHLWLKVTQSISAILRSLYDCLHERGISFIFGVNGDANTKRSLKELLILLVEKVQTILLYFW